MHRALTRATALLLAAFAAACASRASSATGEVAEAEAASEAVSLTVNNDAVSAMNVYVVSSGGSSSRVGSVSGGSSATFKLDPSYFPNGQIVVIARPTAGQGEASSGPLLVARGKRVTFTVRSDLRNSTATVW